MSVTIYQRIKRAAALDRGLRLAAKDVRALMADEMIRSVADQDDIRQCSESGHYRYRASSPRCSRCGVWM